jgi:replicative DNA helicase
LDLRESGSPKQDAEYIVFLWCGEYYNIAMHEDGTPTAVTALLDIAKHRNSATDEVIAGCSIR